MLEKWGWILGLLVVGVVMGLLVFLSHGCGLPSASSSTADFFNAGYRAATDSGSKAQTLHAETKNPTPDKSGDNVTVTKPAPGKILILMQGDAKLDGTIFDTWANTQNEQGKTESHTGTGSGAGSGSGVPKGSGWGFKVWGGIALVLCIVATAVLLYLKMTTFAIYIGGGLGVVGVACIIVGILLDTAESIPWWVYAIGGLVFFLTLASVVFFILYRKHKDWFVNLAAVVKSTGSIDIARANADLLSDKDKADQKKVLVSEGVLLPTTPAPTVESAAKP
jgi:hypothetical protein